MKWLLEAGHPSVRYFTMMDLLDVPANSPEAVKARRSIANGPQVRTLLAGQLPDGGFGRRPYQKWHGAHWRLVSLVELGVPKGFPPAIAAAETVLAWIESEDHYPVPYKVAGRWRCHASIPGNALAVCTRLGLANDPRVRRLAALLLETQWPDGGWNCDPSSAAHHSSFHESLSPLWGLVEYWHAARNPDVRIAAHGAAELFLRHHLFLSDRTSRIIDRRWLVPHCPPYWHYDIFQALLVLSRFSPLADPRVNPALDVVEQKRRPDGRWNSGQRYWRLVREKSNKPVEVLDWGRSGPNKMVTLNALRVLKAAGRA
ncbi:MAG: hypothetical protein HZB43_12545 [candidate division Zixibacteria bacterium]|nr:hypothetical protein [candidate division Zixibacteria bacterium]